MIIVIVTFWFFWRESMKVHQHKYWQKNCFLKTFEMYIKSMCIKKRLPENYLRRYWDHRKHVFTTWSIVSGWFRARMKIVCHGLQALFGKVLFIHLVVNTLYGLFSVNVDLKYHTVIVHWDIQSHSKELVYKWLRFVNECSVFFITLKSKYWFS